MAPGRAPFRLWPFLALGASALLNVALGVHALRPPPRRAPAAATPKAPVPADEAPGSPGRVVTKGLKGTARAVLAGFAGRPDALAYSADGSRLAVGTSSGQISLWDVGSGAVRWRADLSPECLGSEGSSIDALAFAPDKRTIGYICPGSSNPCSSLRVVDTDSVRSRILIPEHVTRLFPNDPKALAFAADGKTLAVGTQKGITLLDPFDGKARGVLRDGRRAYYFRLTFSTGAPTLLACRVNPSCVLVFDTISKTRVAEVKAPEDRQGAPTYVQVALSPDGCRVAASTSGNQVALWDRTTGEPIAFIPEGKGAGWMEHQCLTAFTPDGASLLTASLDDDGSKIFARRRDAATGALVARVELTQPGEPFPYSYPYAIAPDGKTLVSLGVRRGGESGCCAETFLVIHDISPLLRAPAPAPQPVGRGR